MLIFIASFSYVLAHYPTGMTFSADANAATLPLWAIVGPPIIGTVLALTLPHRTHAPISAESPRQLLVTTASLVALSLIFSFSVTNPGSDYWGYIGAKVALLILLPLFIVRLLPDSIRLIQPQGQPWWIPLSVVAIWFIGAQLAPWNPTFDGSGYDPTVLIVGALITALTAGFGEEFFYRQLLQSRLEALLGAGSGIALTALLFALMHLGSHNSGDFIDTLARIIFAQGTFGLFLGVLWWRYRAFSLVVLIHVLQNGWSVLLFLLGKYL